MLQRSTATTGRKIFHRFAQLFSVRVRFAPSPTGFMHIGGLRTALFNYLLARKHKGQFIVRIEDTDKNREVQGSIQNIFQTLKWIDAQPDQSIQNGGQYGPYIQSERLHIYKAIEKQLLKTNKAYPCFCKKEDKNQDETNQSHFYNKKCRNLSFQEIKSRILAKQEYAIRIKSDIIQTPKKFTDQVYGQLYFMPLDDFIIVRSNGWPTFHFANVIDDWKMGVTHVLRGQQWLSNTNKHIYLYNLLEATAPKFAHLPLIKSMNGKKLAKRDPQSAVNFFQTGKYQVDAIKSYLCQMGINRASQSSKEEKQDDQKVKENSKKEKKPVKKQEQNLKLLSESQMIENFDISRITKVPIKFDIKHLNFLNKQSLKKKWKVAKSLEKQMKYFISKTNQFIPQSKNYSRQYIIKFLDSVIERFTFITDIPLYSYYFKEPNYNQQQSIKDFKKLFGAQAFLQKNDQEQNTFIIRKTDINLQQKNKKIIHNLRIIFQHIIEPSSFSQLEIVKRISEFLYQSPEVKNQDAYHLLRYLVSGRKSGPNIGMACEIIGREKILRRISNLLFDNYKN